MSKIALHFKWHQWRPLLLLTFLVLQLGFGANFVKGEACSTHQFECAKGQCIPQTWMCDGENDCGDFSDEQHCTETTVSCSETEYACSSGRCIPARWQCDREQDCDDGSDESEDICVGRTCSPEEWTCKSKTGECIPLSWVCDDHEDCEDKSDEKGCNQTCTPEEFTCDNGNCIQKKWLCDLEDDCGDGSDELKCPENKCDRKNDFACGNGYCITKRWRCDGDLDCPDATDEMGCSDTKRNSSFVNCSDNEFRCLNKFYCIHKTWLCDGDTDCPDGSDESVQVCGIAQECRSDQFTCDNGECIPGHLQCSGKTECSDGSDEKLCRDPEIGCDLSKEFDCGGDGKMCIPLDRVCNGKNDCGNWADEPKDFCEVNECSQSLIHDTKQPLCDQQCIDLPIGYKCACKEGYELVGNSTCQDINECDIPGTCSQLCINQEGSFKCECTTSGYIKDPHDPTRCRAVEGHASLLFAHKTDIRKIALDHHNSMVSIVNETRSSCAIDFNFRTGMIYWSDVMTQKIYKAPIDEGYKKEVVIDHNIVTADGLAVDWLYSHLYWTDTGTNSICMSDLDGNLVTTIITDHLEEPRAIALHPSKGWMFWSDWGESPKIERAGMDGSHRSAIINEGVRWPNGITLDLVLDRIYWIDAKLNLIGSADLDGANSRVVLSSPEMLKHPFSITLFGDWMYWTDWDRNAIFQADKFNGKHASLVANSSMIPMVIHVYHPYRQPDAHNYCLPMNGRCSHICLPAPQLTANSAKTSCTCPRGLKLDKDNLNCIHDPSYTRLRVTTDEPYLTNFMYDNNAVEPDFETEAENVTSNNSTKDSYDASTDGHAHRDPDKDEPSTSSARSKGATTRSRHHEHNEGFLAGVAIGVASGALVLLAILGIALYRKFWYKSLHTINFDNPVYRKTTEENVNLERDPSSVSMTSSVTMSTSVSANGAKRSYTSNTLATDVSEDAEVEPLNSKDPSELV